MGITKQKILEAIRQTAKENGGNPLGRDAFQRETGITEWNCSKYWPRFSDAQKEAGFEPNKFRSAFPDELFIEQLTLLIRKFGKFPTLGEMNVERNINPKLPSLDAFRRLGNKKQIAERIVKYFEGKSGYEDVVEICQPILEKADEEKNDDSGLSVGEVYLFKSGRYYKIGKTRDTVRRGTELLIQLPEKLDLIHSIKTDDPSGIEAYWHKRFAPKRKQGEWFDLSAADVRAFKLWRRII